MHLLLRLHLKKSQWFYTLNLLAPNTIDLLITDSPQPDADIPLVYILQVLHSFHTGIYHSYSNTTLLWAFLVFTRMISQKW